MSETISKYHIGEVISSKSPLQLSQAIIKLLDNTVRREMSNNFKLLNQELYWNRTTEPLVKFCEDPKISFGKELVMPMKNLYSNKKIKLFKLIKYLKNGDFKTIYNKIKKN
ncbi:hypothetical protein AMQ83_07570 [Paenibacillus riograndensis]|nr:hypothetical protein AMQ83_07570 [Paenibacillus riograndensis]